MLIQGTPAGDLGDWMANVIKDQWLIYKSQTAHDALDELRKARIKNLRLKTHLQRSPQQRERRQLRMILHLLQKTSRMLSYDASVDVPSRMNLTSERWYAVRSARHGSTMNAWE